MSIVGGYPMPQNYGHAAMCPTANSEALYSSYYSHPSPPGHHGFYQSWGYPTGYGPDISGCADYGVTGGFVVGPGSPQTDYCNGEYTIEMIDGCGRVVKRRSSANKKERRRTQSINNAFAELRDCIPNVPADTKLSKIKTLRLATSYIAYLMGVLRTDVQDIPSEGFKAELPPKQKIPPEVIKQEAESDEKASKKGRTGWPQEVWAQELNK